MSPRQGSITHAYCPEKSTAAIDWFRYLVTAPRAVKQTLDAVRDLQTEDCNRGSALRPWYFQGWKGHATDSVRWGVRGLSLIWESSGDQTPFTVSRVPLSGGSAKRIDLQVTLDFSSAQPSFGRRCLKPSTRMQTHRRQSGPLVGQSSRTDGLWCGTVGRRTAPSYWRVYDKGVESRTAPPGHKWRLELETKFTLAEELCNKHQSSLGDPGFIARYCVSSWRAQGFCWPVSGFDGTCELVGAPRKPDPSWLRLMTWAMATIRPVTQKLLTVLSAAEILELYGLQDVATPTRRDDARC